MAQSLVTLFNQALSLVGDRNGLSDPEAKSPQANACRLWYETSRDMILSSAPWPSSRRFKNLTLIRERTEDIWDASAPSPTYKYSYILPNDCLHPWYLADWSRFELGFGSSERSLHTNTKDPILFYGANDTPIPHWETPLFHAVTRLLAANINSERSGKVSVTNNLLEIARDQVSASVTTFSNQEDTQVESTPDFFAARGFEMTLQTTRYYYPVNAIRVGGL